MRCRRQGPKKFEVNYRNGDSTVEYVARTAVELRVELRRVQRHIQEAVRALATLKRVRHCVIMSASFQLKHAIHKLPDDVSDEAIAQEIARLSFLMEDTLVLLNRLTNCRVSNLEAVRFLLTYGQTPKKRDTLVHYGSRSKNAVRDNADTGEEETENSVESED